MTAISPYAPTRRNSFLRQSSSSIRPSSASSSGPAAFAFFLFVIRFWKEATKGKTIQDFLKRPTVQKFLQWIKAPFGFFLDGAPRSINTGLLDSPQPTADVPVRSFSLRSTSDQSEASSLDDQRSYSSTTIRLCENQLLIRSVLKYWFGQYSPDSSQKHLWMIANSSVALRSRVDKEITEKFENLLLDLSVSDLASKRWNEWCIDRDGIYDYQGKVAAIIVLDQFSRHIQRYHENNKDGKESNHPPKAQLDALAYRTAQLLVEKHKVEIECGMIPLPMYIFSLMPYRHASTIESVTYVQQQVESCASMNEQMEAMLGRFRKASNRRMALLQDEARRTGGAEKNQDRSDDLGAVIYNDENILETFPFETDLKPALAHPVHKTIVSFLEQNGILPTPGGKSNVAPIIVSLSGGVDSMVIAAVLSHLNKSCGYNLLIIAVHIDYGNRPESEAEADFVRRYCEGKNIQPFIRRIDEVTRGVTARDDYEKKSREIRYSSYRVAIENAMGQIEQSRNPATVGVMLGHHRGDLRENVLSNAHKGCGPLDLSGMTSVSKNDGVTIYRPLLPLEKTSVFDYAHKFGVPYFKDTTPHWSTRGKLRNKLLPLLQEIYGEGSMNNLSELATESDECRKLLFKSAIGPFLEQIERKPMGIAFNTTPWKEQPLFFWKFVLREALHSARFGMFSDKSVMSFLQRVTAKKVSSAWLQCRKDYAVYLREDGKVFVFYPSSFPWHKKDMYMVEGQVAVFNEEKEVGPWKVKAEVVSEKADCPDRFRLAQKAIPSMDDLMQGNVEYFLESPTSYIRGKFVPQPLVFCQFRKAYRPLAWKNTDLKVQSTLPILGNDEEASVAIKDSTGNESNPLRLVRVSLRLNRP